MLAANIVNTITINTEKSIETKHPTTHPSKHKNKDTCSAGDTGHHKPSRNCREWIQLSRSGVRQNVTLTATLVRGSSLETSERAIRVVGWRVRRSSREMLNGAFVVNRKTITAEESLHRVSPRE